MDGYSSTSMYVLPRKLTVFDASQGERKRISPICPLFCHWKGVLAGLVRRDHH